MTAIAHYSDVLNDNMIAAWPRVAAALQGLDCALMGGTAVAMVPQPTSGLCCRRSPKPSCLSSIGMAGVNSGLNCV